jgi:hypothetical protein
LRRTFAPGGVDYCTCPFLQWGRWSAAMDNAAGSTAGITAAGLEGSFYRSPTDATVGVASRFGINGTGNHQASGTFVAGKTATGP